VLSLRALEINVIHASLKGRTGEQANRRQCDRFPRAA